MEMKVTSKSESILKRVCQLRPFSRDVLYPLTPLHGAAAERNGYSAD